MHLSSLDSTPHGDQFFNSHIAHLQFLGQHHAYQLAQLLVGIVGERLSLQQHHALQRGLKGRQRTQKSGLTHTITTQQTDEFATLYDAIQSGGDDFLSAFCGVTNTEVLEHNTFLHATKVQNYME